MQHTADKINDEMQRKIDELEGSDRQLRGILAISVAIIAIAMSLFHLYTAGFGVISEQRVVHLSWALIIVYLLFPYKKGTGQTTIPWYDLLLAGVALFIGSYKFINFSELAARSGDPTTFDTVVSFALILLILEATRRVLGLPLMIIALIFITYGLIGYKTTPYLEWLIPEAIYHQGYDFVSLVTKLDTDEGIFGMPIYVSSTYVVIFIIFGALFDATGAGKMFIQSALSALGSFRGGPAKAAVVGSGVMGSISGSSVANVVTTGTFTIPLMKKVGFKPQTAGGIEVASSSSGQLLPPVMGAAAFIMAETTGLPYLEIAIAAIIPSILAYMAILFMVHIEALKHDIKGIPRKQLTPLKMVLSLRGFLAFPIVGLIYYLMQGFTPTKAAYIAIIMIILLGLFSSWMENYKGMGYLLSLLVVFVAFGFNVFGNLPSEFAITGAICIGISIIGMVLRSRFKEEAKQDRLHFGWREFLAALEVGAKNAVSVAVACAAAGILVGVVTTTGLGVSLSTIIVGIAELDLSVNLFGLELGVDPIYAVLIAAMVACMIMGLGLPTTATYIVLAAVMAPALVDVGVSLIAAHLFVFYYGILADDTPPINLPGYAAAGIAKSEPVKTGVQGFKYDSGALLLPFAFVMNEHLLLQAEGAPWYETAWAIVTALLGIIAFSTFIQKHMIKPYSWIERLLALSTTILLINQSQLTDYIGIGIIISIFLFQKFVKKDTPRLQPS
ncbi:TRAP transporter permease [Longirhabdus pacifica]|uniref:TRAP transporter permease n=1 Tax=Longirhabdus pacifica TaxID=2305227 RepID=UPI001F0B90B2|nr:TRAP transporter permease [Longirhabdus pacifica]